MYCTSVKSSRDNYAQGVIELNKFATNCFIDHCHSPVLHHYFPTCMHTVYIKSTTWVNHCTIQYHLIVIGLHESRCVEYEVMKDWKQFLLKTKSFATLTFMIDAGNCTI